jgi:DNA-binding NarL/FixJ family response regulator
MVAVTSVLLVDDHALFRKGVRALLATMDGVVVVGEAQSGPEAVTVSLEVKPDVVLLDLQMPGGSGLEAIPGIRHAAPDAAILVVTMRGDDAAVREALLLGARGYLLKDTEGDDFIRAIASVARGDTHLDRRIADQLTSLLHDRTTVLPFPDLTERERAVLTLMARGRANGEIARELFLSTKTVQNYVSKVFLKIGVRDRAQAIVAAREKGLHLH